VIIIEHNPQQEMDKKVVIISILVITFIVGVLLSSSVKKHNSVEVFQQNSDSTQQQKLIEEQKKNDYTKELSDMKDKIGELEEKLSNTQLVLSKIADKVSALNNIDNSGIIRVGLLICATGKYVSYVNRLVDTFQQHFLVNDKNYELYFFIFTDGDFIEKQRVKKIFQKRLGWPFDTMKRFHMYNEHKQHYSMMNYLFSVDSDLLCIQDVPAADIISNLVGTEHNLFINIRGTYETRPESTAYVSNREGEYYFFGAFWGGKTSEILIMCATIQDRIDIDLSKNIIAVWHDESHLNRYFIDHKPTLVLKNKYVTAEGSQNAGSKLIQLNKNHAQMRDCDNPQKVCKIGNK